MSDKDHCDRNANHRKDRRVCTIEHSPVPAENVAIVFDIEVSFYQREGEVP